MEPSSSLIIASLAMLLHKCAPRFLVAPFWFTCFAVLEVIYHILWRKIWRNGGRFKIHFHRQWFYSSIIFIRIILYPSRRLSKQWNDIDPKLGLYSRLHWNKHVKWLFETGCMHNFTKDFFVSTLNWIGITFENFFSFKMNYFYILHQESKKSEKKLR